MKKTLAYVFENFSSATESEQRNFFREVFENITVLKDNQIQLNWRFTEAGFGGKKFFLEEEWGRRHNDTQPRLPPVELTNIINFPVRPDYLNEAFLRQKYEVENHSLVDLAEMIGCGASTVSKYLKKFHIQTRGSGKNIRPRRHLGYGSRIEGRNVVVHKGEMETMEKMAALRKQGFSYWKIADILNSMKVPTKTRRGKWHARSVQQILDAQNSSGVRNPKSPGQTSEPAATTASI